MAKPGSRKAKAEYSAESFIAAVEEFGQRNPKSLPHERIAHAVRLGYVQAGVDAPLVDMWTSLTLESDRGCVLVAAAVMDGEIETLLRKLFSARSPTSGTVINSLFTPNKEQDMPPLQNTSLKIKLAYCLGLIDDDLRKACVMLQRMRSTVFAHTRQVQFLRYKDTTDLLRCFSDVFIGELTEEEVATRLFGLLEESNEPNPKGAFVYAAMTVVIRIGFAITKVRQRRSHQTPGSAE